MTPSVADLPARTVTVRSRLFGPMEVRPGAWITLPEGLLGFGGERRFLVLPAAQAGVYWLQDVDEGNVAFLAVDPVRFHPGYAIAGDEPAGETPAPGPDDDVSAVCLVTLGQRNQPCTVNLQAPIVIDFGRRTGRQVILAAGTYHTRHPIELARAS